MATGYLVSGRGDLDALFKPRSSAAGANTGFLSNGGADLAQRFEPRGGTAAIAATNFKAGANDLAQLFMGITASTTHTMHTSTESSPANVGYSDGRGGVAMPGSTFTPLAVKTWEVCYLASVGTFDDINFQLFGSNVVGAAPNTDAAFVRLRITGVFTDSGATQTKTLVRSAAGYFNSPVSGGFFASWSWNTIPWKFVLGNNYTVEIDY